MISSSNMAASIDIKITLGGKFDKKLKKKLTKFKDRLEENEGIQITENPSKVLCILNGGLDNGVTREELSTTLNLASTSAEIIMVPRKPYCFVCFSHIEDAIKIVEEKNGVEIGASQGRKYTVILYLAYVDKVPSRLSPCNKLPPGLILLENFITETVEKQLVACLKWTFDSELKHREVKHYGYEFKYGINDVDADCPLDEPIPPECEPLMKRALGTGHVKYLPDQLTVNKYSPGQGIPSHVDTPAAFEDGIMSLSLLSQIVMEFSHPDGQQLSVLLPRRSLLIMTGESRYVWSHGITPRKSDIVSTENGLDLATRQTRISFTFRKIIHPKDRVGRIVPFQNSKVTVMLPQSDQEAEKLENSHVQEVYEEIADHFSGTRHTPWPRIAQFIKDLPVGSIMADIGCGNGKYLGLNNSIYEIGSDRSFNLSEICRQRSREVYVGDVLNIPLRSDLCDVCICIAVIHHMSTQARREKAIEELLRILRPGGRLLIYVWAMEQELHQVKSKYLKEGKLNSGETHKQHNSTVLENEPVIHENIEKNGDIQCNRLKGDIEPQFEQPSNEICGEQCSIEDVSVQISQASNNIPSQQSCGESPCCSLTVHKNRTHFQQQDVLVPWEKKNSTSEKKNFHRFYHVFRKGELEDLCRNVGGCQVIDSYYDQGNWAVILQKDD